MLNMDHIMKQAVTGRAYKAYFFSEQTSSATNFVLLMFFCNVSL